MRAVKAIALPAALIALAELAYARPGGGPDSLAPPSAVVQALIEAIGDGSLLIATLETLAAMLGGLAMGAGAGLFLGFVIGLSRAGVILATPSVELFRPIPSVALIPLAMLIYGFGYRMEMSIVAFATFWPCLILAQAAAGQVEPRLLEVARIIGLDGPGKLLKIVLPAALPRIFVALRLAAGFALVVAVTVEIAANPQGLGYMLMIAQQTLRPETMLAALVWVGVLGFTVNAGLIALERRLFPHQTAAPEAGR